MIASEKQKIIRKQGSPIVITDKLGATSSTKSIVGRASTQFNNLLSLEAHRKGYFLPSVNIDNGYMVKNVLLNEDYLCVAVYAELFGNTVTSIVSHMLLCNSLLTVSRDVVSADDRGKKTTVPVDVVTNKIVYLQKLTQDLKLFDPGLSPTAEYLLYAQDFDLQLLDRVIVSNGMQTMKFKVDAMDKVTYPGIISIQLSYETRK